MHYSSMKLARMKLTNSWNHRVGLWFVLAMLSVGLCWEGWRAVQAVANTWTTKTSMTTARYGLAAAELYGRLYAVGGDTSSGISNKLEVYDPATNNWTALTPMLTARYYLAAASINGKFYAVGGATSSGISNKLEVYDPPTNNWTTLASMPTGRYALAAAAMNGKLYVVGGDTGSGNTGTLEVYDPATNNWTPKTSMPTPRSALAAAAIDGKLYVAGGYDGSRLNTLEVYDSATDHWTTQASMPTARAFLAAAAINGKLYTVGGNNDSGFQNKLEVYDPATNTWTTKAPMPTARNGLAAGGLNGKLYAVGGSNGSSLSTLEVYEPAEPVWAGKPGMPSPRSYLAAAAINGKLYVVGGDTGSVISNKLEVYDPATNNWATLASMPTARSGLAAAAIDGKLYVVGGHDGVNNLNKLEVYDPATNNWTTLAPMPTARRYLAAAANPLSEFGKLYVIGGVDASNLGVNTLEVYDPVTNNWTPKPSMPTARSGLAAVLLAGKLYAVGGFDNDIGSVDTLEVYDPATNNWTLKAHMPTPRYDLAAVALAGKLYAVGGAESGQVLGMLEAYDPATNTWTVTVPMPTPRRALAAAELGGQLYAVGGGTNSSNSLNTLEVFQSAPDLTLTKSHTGNFVGGSQGQYTLTVTNNPVANYTTGVITITDMLPAGLSYVSATGTGWSCAANGQNVTCTNASTTLAPGAQSSVTLSVLPTVIGNVMNSASVATPDEINTANNNASDQAMIGCATITGTVSGGGVLCPSAATVTVTVSGGVAPYTVVLDNGGGTQTGNGPTFNFNVSPTATTTYTVFTNSHDANGCAITNSGSATVTLNTAPVLTYAAASASAGGTATVNPATGPSDNGSVASIALLSQGTYTGTISVNNTTGVVSFSNAAPVGTHTITIRATDNCGLTTDTTLSLLVFVCTSSISVNDTGDASDAFPGNGICETGAGTGICTLRAAIQEANVLPASCGLIEVNFSSVSGTINLTSALPDINRSLTITGPGASQLTVRRSAAVGIPDFRIFNILSGKVVTIQYLTIANGSSLAGQSGGGIQNNSGTLTVNNCVFTGNASGSGFGAAIRSTGGPLTINHSTFTGNTAGDCIGNSFGALTITNSTISGNAGTNAIKSQDAQVTLTNCTVSNSGRLQNLSVSSTPTMTLTNCTLVGSSPQNLVNSNPVGPGANMRFKNTILSGSPLLTSSQLTAVFTSLGNNLLSDNGSDHLMPLVSDQLNTNALLAPLGNYGGATQTYALLPGSPAINAGNNTGAPTTDQRGIARPQQTTVDSGAFESQGFTLSTLSGGNQSTGINNAFENPLAVTVAANVVGEPVNGGAITFTPPVSGASATLTGNPATIANGVATSGVVTANGTLGGPYIVTANARGTNSVNFALTNLPTLAVSIPMTLSGSTGSTVLVPVLVPNLTGLGVLSYDFKLLYNQAELRLNAMQPEDHAGTLSHNMQFTVNTAAPGAVTVSAFGLTPLSGAGTLLYLKFDLLGSPPACSNLTWNNFRFNEGNPFALPANGRVCVSNTTIAGKVSYYSVNLAIPGVTVATNADFPNTSTTDANGNYILAAVIAPVTVAPAKTGNIAGIQAYDASLVAQYVAGLLTLSDDQFTAGDGSNNGALTSFDASLIAQFAVGTPNNSGVVGNWKFNPANRAYPTLSGNQDNQNYTAILVGDVTGNWAPTNRPTTPGNPNRPLAQAPIAFPTLSLPPGGSVTVPITVGDLTGQGVTAYDFAFTFDSAVLQLQDPAFDATGTLSSGLTILSNTTTPGRLQISAFGISPLAGAGTLLNLKFNVVGAGGTTSPLTWQTFLLNEDPQTMLTNGSVAIVSPCPSIIVNPSNPTLPNGHAGTAYSQTFTQTGGAGTVNFSVSAGVLPTGLTLAGAVLSGTPTVSGSFGFTIRATDSNGCFGERAYTLLLHPPCTTITVNPATLANGFQGTAYSQTLTASGGTAPHTFAVTAGSLPGGLNLASGGALMGTPTTAGTFNFTVTATDNTGCTGTRAYTVIISGNGLQFYPLAAPVRLLDTRNGATACTQPNAPIAGQTSLNQAGRSLCSIPANALALTGNITTVNSGGGFLTLYPSDAAQPTVASTNYAPNEIINNVFTVGLGTDGAFKIFAFNTTDVVVDVTGYYAPPASGGLFFHPLPKPIRLLETRAGQVGCNTPGAPIPGGDGGTLTQQARITCDGVTIPSAALAIVGNATTVGPQGGGFLTLFPANAARPLVASSNYNPGQIVNGPFSVGLAPNGEFKIFSFATTDLVVDVLGYYSTEASDANGAGLLFSPLPKPVRLLETRLGQAVGCFKPGAPLNGQQEYTQTARGLCDGVTVPANALGVVGNATVVGPLGPGFLTLWPSSAAIRPTVATANYNPGDVGNRHFIVGLGQADGAFKMYSFATSNLVIDLSGYFAP